MGRVVYGEVNLDRLKVCFKHNPYLWDYLTTGFNLNNTQFNELECDTLKIEMPDFDLVLIDFEIEDGKVVKMSVAVDFNMDGNSHRLGHFNFAISGKYKAYTFFEFENKALYTAFSLYPRKYSVAGHLDYIASYLKLEHNNITSVEVALDCNVNVIHRLQKMIKDTTNYDMFYNGHLIKTNRRLDNYMEIKGRSRDKVEKYPTIIFKQKGDAGLSMKIYDKAKEMAGTEKQTYISDWLDFAPSAAIYRMEITVKNMDIKDFCALTGHYEEEILMLLTTNNEWLCNLWGWCAHRLLFFRNRDTGKEINMIDLLQSM